MTDPRENKWTTVARYPEDGLKVGNFDTRSDAQDAKEQAVTDLGAEQARLFPPGEVPDTDDPFGSEGAAATGESTDTMPEGFTTAKEQMEQAAGVVPGDMAIDQDPLDVLPSWMVTQVSYNDRGDTSTTVNKRGCQVIAEYLGLKMVDREAVERAHDTGFEYATYEVTMAKSDGREFTGVGTARADGNDQAEDDGWKLDMQAETRAYKRAVKAATGGGIEAFAKERGAQ